MAEILLLRPPCDVGEPPGCAYILAHRQDGSGGRRCCGRPRQPGSSYCSRHHARCHLPSGSAAESLCLQGLETLAAIVGGRSGSAGKAPPSGFLARLERAAGKFF